MSTAGNPMQPRKKLMGVKEAALYLGMTESALRHLVELRKVPYRRPANYARLFFDQDALFEWTGSGVCVTAESLKGGN